MDAADRGRAELRDVCATCQTPLAGGEEPFYCPACGAPYHVECWEGIGGCAVYGCPQVPKTESRRAVEIPPAYWGREKKTCPSCKAEILAAAVRCRNCGTTFSSARPETTGEFRDRREVERRLPDLRRNAVILFIFCLLPCTAPFAALVGGIWFGYARKDFARLPSIYGGLAKIGLGVGIGQTVFMTFIFAVSSLMG